MWSLGVWKNSLKKVSALGRIKLFWFHILKCFFFPLIGRRLFQITCLDVKAAIYEDDTEIVEDEFLLSLPDYTSVVVTARTEQMEIAPVAVPATVPRIKTSDSPVAVVPPSTTGSLTTPRIIMLRNPQGIPQLTLMQSVPSVKLINNMSQL